MKLFFAFALLLFTESNTWLTSFDSAKETSSKEGKFILLNFSGSDWCAPCIKMKRDVFGNAVFKEYAGQRLVLLNADFPRMKKNQLSEEQIQHNEALAARYNREGKFPYTVLLDTQGNVKKIWDGYGDRGADKFVSEIKKAIEEVIPGRIRFLIAYRSRFGKSGLLIFVSIFLSHLAEGQPHEITHRTQLLGSWFEATAVADNDSVAWKSINAVVKETNRIDHLISEWDSTSQTTLINHNAGIKPVKVDAELFDLIERSIKVSKLTDGAFDISFASMLKIWRFDGSMKEMPDPTSIKTAASKIGYQNIVLDRHTNTIFLKEKGMKIGFGGIGQGYVANRGKKIMLNMGITSGLINVSGDICAWGKRANGSDWSVGITNPKNKDEIACWLPLSNLCLSTSGDYEKFVMFDGKRYSHIIDPRTGYPAQGVSSVTVVCPDTELSDALDTGIFVMGVEKGMALINRLKSIECLIIDDKGNMHTSKNLKVLPQRSR